MILIITSTSQYFECLLCETKYAQKL